MVCVCYLISPTVVNLPNVLKSQLAEHFFVDHFCLYSKERDQSWKTIVRPQNPLYRRHSIFPNFLTPQFLGKSGWSTSNDCLPLFQVSDYMSDHEARRVSADVRFEALPHNVCQIGTYAHFIHNVIHFSVRRHSMIVLLLTVFLELNET